ncbi:autotransporter family protein [Entomomonas asaccharolytica]|uniref:Autotransporter outer membrane beta-barrel domain-containing protein n=1 Tax=Entomomonas asaccharolytica TaxID=2785331 RepID=A0A974NDK6_9GAMM|nr:autotransporter outer membrane beta-barrel domain-containing protein [Entomomonas asaccharolytica]QQP84548.1 autotransporter outer membrane beta-barrel domain-containing protein [Entomomonas asaccharolytica]
MKKSPFILKPMFIGMLSVISSYSVADAIWNGSTKDYKEGNNWSTNTLPDLTVENIIINSGQANLVLDDSYPGFSQWGGSGNNKLIIGGSASASGMLNVSIADGTSYIQPDYGSTLAVGENGGHGTLTLDTTTNSNLLNVGISFDNITVGDGVNGQQSQGFINILGSGKNIYQQSMGGQSLASGELEVGTNGGSGTINIDGSSLDISGSLPSVNDGDVFTLGNGTNSTGTINVLGGGKLAVSVGYQPANSAVIGKDGGTGILNISGQFDGFDMIGDPTKVSSRAVFYKGLVVGDGLDSQGSINIKDGGLLITYGETIIGKNDGTGNILLSGENSRWELSGKASTDGVNSSYDWSQDGVLTLGSAGGTGTLTIDDGAVVSLGVGRSIYGYYEDHDNNQYFNSYDYEFVGGTGTFNLTDSADSTGTLILKGDAGKVGVLDTPQVNFGPGTASVVFNHNDYTGSYEFTPELVGSNATNSYLVNNSGITVFNRDTSQFIGHSIVNGGVFEVNSILGGDMTINNGGTLTGIGTVGSTVLNTGGTIAIGQYNTTTVSTLTINGDYQGNNGTIVFDTVLGNDSSTTDKLIITGDTSGSTYVKVNNLGGLGDQTIRGIELISIQGASNGTFTSSGRIVAGAYNYSLVKGDASKGADPNNWYLTSQYAKASGGLGKDLRTESATYIGLIENNIAAFNHSFHDRQQTLNNGYESSWMRVEYAHDKYHAGENNLLENKVTRKLVHLGTDLYQHDQLHLGIMAAYANSDITSNSRIKDYHSTGKSDGYSAGVYATWYDQDAISGGLYIDSYAQYNWFRNQVNGHNLAQEKFNTQGHTISIETGYNFVISNSKQAIWTVEPQAQIIYGNSSTFNYTEDNGTRIHTNNDKGQIRSRLGVRLQAEIENAKLFLTSNYWNQNKHTAVHMDGTEVRNNRAKNLFEIKTGVQYNINDKIQAFAQLNAITGENSTRSYGGNVGIKYQW